VGDGRYQRLARRATNSGFVAPVSGLWRQFMVPLVRHRFLSAHETTPRWSPSSKRPESRVLLEPFGADITTIGLLIAETQLAAHSHRGATACNGFRPAQLRLPTALDAMTQPETRVSGLDERHAPASDLATFIERALRLERRRRRADSGSGAGGLVCRLVATGFDVWPQPGRRRTDHGRRTCVQRRTTRSLTG